MNKKHLFQVKIYLMILKVLIYFGLRTNYSLIEVSFKLGVFTLLPIEIKSFLAPRTGILK